MIFKKSDILIGWIINVFHNLLYFTISDLFIYVFIKKFIYEYYILFFFSDFYRNNKFLDNFKKVTFGHFEFIDLNLIQNKK